MTRTRFFDFFPPPKFLAMPSVGISFYDDSVQIVSFNIKNGRTVLKIAEDYKMDSGTILNGNIIKRDKLLNTLKNIHNEHGVRFGRIALPEEKAYVFETNIPSQEGDFRSAVEFILEQNIPLSATEAEFDFGRIAGDNSTQEDQTKVVVAAYPKDTVESYAEVFRNSGITPVSFELESQAVVDSVIQKNSEKTNLICYFMPEKVILAVVSNGYVRFSSVISQNGESLSEAFSRHANETIVESVELLTVRDEIKKVVSYWQSEHLARSKDKIDAVIIAGHVSDMYDVVDYISKHVRLPAYLANVWRNAFSFEEFIPNLLFEESLRYAPTIGLALNKHV